MTMVTLGKLRKADLLGEGIDLPVAAVRQICEAGLLPERTCPIEQGFQIDLPALGNYYRDNANVLQEHRTWYEENRPRAKKSARQVVKEHAEELRGMNTHGELYRWAGEHGFASRAGFPAFKKALVAEAGIDYAEIREQAKAQRVENITEQATKRIVLFSDAKASKDRFALVDKNGEPVWFGKFFAEGIEQSEAEMEAAKKAVWLANKIAQMAELPAIQLVLNVDAEWLQWANAVRGGEGNRGGKARELGEQAVRRNVDLRVRVIPGSENPADEYTVCAGYQKWGSRDDLTDLIESEVEN